VLACHQPEHSVAQIFELLVMHMRPVRTTPRKRRTMSQSTVQQSRFAEMVPEDLLELFEVLLGHESLFSSRVTWGPPNRFWPYSVFPRCRSCIVPASGHCPSTSGTRRWRPSTGSSTRRKGP